MMMDMVLQDFAQKCFKSFTKFDKEESAFVDDYHFYYIIRKLSVNECKRLQTVPEWYEFPVSNAQAYKMLGNGWTVEVIIHLIKSCLTT